MYAGSYIMVMGKPPMFTESDLALEYLPGRATPIHLISAGEGPVILFLHGWIASGRKWLNVMRAMPEGHTLYSIDLPGYGASPPLPRKDITIANYRRLGANFIETTSAQRVISAVVADSLGAILTLMLLGAPGLARARLFLSGCPVQGLRGVFRLSQVPGLVSTNMRLIRRLPRSIAIPVIKAGSFASMNDSRYVDGPKIDDVLSSDPLTSELLAGQLCRPCIDNIAAGAGDHKCAILRGRGDLFVSAKSSRMLAERLGGDYFEIEGARHNPMIENEPEYLKILLAFLRA